MTPSHSDFLRAIIAAPDDDLPRLAYADFLEESGELERAEFIRVQCESESMDNEKCTYNCVNFIMQNQCPNCQDKYRLDLRACDLRNQFADKWSGLNPPHDDFYLGWKRGFISEIHLTLSQFFGGECGRCDGTGMERYADSAGDMDDMPCVDCGGGWEPRYHRGTGRTPALGPQIFRDHPVERVVLSDREPYLYKPNGSYRFCTMNQDYMPYDLPAEIIKNMDGDYGYDSSQRQYPTREAAIDALSDACCRWARAEADKLEPVAA